MRILLTCLLISGCTMYQPKWEMIDGVNVMFTPEPQAECAKEFNVYPPPGQMLLGCQTMLGDEYFIIALRGSQVAFKHEMRHVTEGDFHK